MTAALENGVLQLLEGDEAPTVEVVADAPSPADSPFADLITGAGVCRGSARQLALRLHGLLAAYGCDHLVPFSEVEEVCADREQARAAAPALLTGLIESFPLDRVLQLAEHHPKLLRVELESAEIPELGVSVYVRNRDIVFAHLTGCPNDEVTWLLVEQESATESEIGAFPRGPNQWPVLDWARFGLIGTSELAAAAAALTERAIVVALGIRRGDFEVREEVETSEVLELGVQLPVQGVLLDAFCRIDEADREFDEMVLSFETLSED